MQPIRRDIPARTEGPARPAGQSTTHEGAGAFFTIGQTDARASVTVDEAGWVRVEGVVIGRRVEVNGEVCLQVCDKDRRRSAERGTRFPSVSLVELVEALQKGEIEFCTSFAPFG